MSKIYQPTHDIENWIPHNLYMEIIFKIRDYDRKNKMYVDMILESPAPPDGMPKGTGISDPTAAKVAKLEKLRTELEAVEFALKRIPEEYRQPIIDNICNNTRYPDYADRKTWSKWKGRLIRWVGENLDLV